MRATRSLLGACLAACLLVSGCGGEPASDPQPDSPSSVLRAVDATQRARGLVVDSVDRVVKAAAAIDDRDEAAARGDRTAVARLAEQTPLDLDLLDKVVASLPEAAGRYVESVRLLTEASEAYGDELPVAQRDPLDAVVAAAAAEAAADTAVASAVGVSWSTFRATARRTSTWLTRSRSGWYRDQREAADAYAVLTADLRAKLGRSRRALAGATANADRAAAAYGAAVARLRAAPTASP